MSVYNGRLLVNEVVRLLTAAGLTVSVSRRPKDVHRVVVVDPIAGGLVEGPLDDPHGDVSPRIQLTIISTGWEQALQDVTTATTAVLDASAYVLSGRSVLFVEQEMVGGVESDWDVSPPIYWSTHPFRFNTVPA